MSEILQCFIIDDEPDSRELIKKFVSRVPFLEITGEFGNAVDALFQVQNLKPDLIFLDVEMPEMNGFEFIRTLQAYRPKIIMVTAYPQYAVEGFEHQVTDYLLKPTSFERFMRAIHKVVEQLQPSQPVNAASGSREIITAAEPVIMAGGPKKAQHNGNDFLLIKEDKKLVRILTDEIILIEAMRDYIKIHLPTRIIITHNTMGKIEAMLPAGRFLRVNRSFILRINIISEINGNQIITTDGKKVDIGVTYREDVMHILKSK